MPNREDESKDDGQQDLSESQKMSDRPILVIVPGLSGDTSNMYCLTPAYAALERDYDCVIVGYRGLSLPIKTPKVYHGADSDDLDEVMEYLYKELCCDEKGVQRRRLIGVGVSLGASIIALYAARKGESNRFDAAGGVGCNFDFHEMIKFITTSCFGFYDFAIGRNLALKTLPAYVDFDKLVEKKRPGLIKLAPIVSGLWRFSGLSLPCTIMAGFESEAAFIAATEVKSHMHMIRKPFFFISALDDQLFGPKVIPISEVHDNILLGVTRYGGHISYLEGGLLPNG